MCNKLYPLTLLIYKYLFNSLFKKNQNTQIVFIGCKKVQKSGDNVYINYEKLRFQKTQKKVISGKFVNFNCENSKFKNLSINYII